MTKNETASGWIVFDQVEIDLAGRRLFVAGAEMPLEPKAFAVLALLARNPGQAFARDDILDAVWGHRHVTPGVLNRVITLLRQALGESAEATQYLHTLHGVGHRFDAATQILLDLRPKRLRELPGGLGLFTAGAMIGGVASLVAAGGAFLCIPFLAWCRVPLRRAIGTAAAIGLPIALAGTLGYVLQGLRAEGLPSPTLGYVYLPALVLVVATSMAAAPLGARVAHRLPVKQLRIIFALLLYVLAVRMLVSVW